MHDIERVDRAEVGNQGGGGDPQSERAYRAKLERRRYIHTHKCIERMRRRKKVLLTGNSSNHIVNHRMGLGAYGRRA